MQPHLTNLQAGTMQKYKLRRVPNGTTPLLSILIGYRGLANKVPASYHHTPNKGTPLSSWKLQNVHARSVRLLANSELQGKETAGFESSQDLERYVYKEERFGNKRAGA